MSTYMAKPNEVEKKWYVIDAAGKPLGRVAAQVATILRGKHRPEYTPGVYRHTGYIGHLKEVSYKDLMAKRPEKAMELAVAGMMPHNSLGRKELKKLRIYAGAEHGHEAQSPVEWTREF